MSRSFSDERGSGTFHSLGVLPKRTRDISTRKSPVFNITPGDDDHSSALDTHSPQALSVLPHIIHFTSSGTRSPSTPRPPSPDPQLSRGASPSVLLSGGRPLKSSLKSSASSPTVLIPPHAQHMHQRSRSEPSTPKNVHFPEKDHGLATVCLFKYSARPAALSNPASSDGDETETEGEDNPSTRFPFPPSFPGFNYEIDPTKSSPVPSKPSPLSNLFLESLNLSPSSPGKHTKPMITGFILVRNLSFEKDVAIRFTFDDWETVSEVGAHYVNSLSHPPSQVLSSPSTSPQRGRGWDRFVFTIHLEDHAHSLSTRTLWLAARYRTNSTYPDPGSSQNGPGGEWWDNNDGSNHRVGFRHAVTASSFSRGRPRRETISAPISSPHNQPAACKEHAFGHMIPSISKNNGDRRLTPLRTRKHNLCNYVPPTGRATASVSFPSADSSPTSSPSSISNSALLPSSELRSPSDEDTASPVSPTLSTPSASPTIIPCVTIGGLPATPTYNSSEKEEDAITSPRPAHIADCGWSAPINPQTEGLPHQHINFVPGPEPPQRRFDIQFLQGPLDSDSLYDAVVTQWCFAQGYTNNNGYDGGGIMA
ncbi:carbohydrate-binding module family 21 protein [Boletus coccyginus]|nr:carbohydrate-binding module family 21 protein [Boletus coccyginus]